MNYEQMIVRWVLMVPTLALTLLFLPERGSYAYHFPGVFDPFFVFSSSLDLARLIGQVFVVVTVGLIFDWLVKDKTTRA